ncbi:MAG: hypothetical protein U0637_02515 [Phycisphaerales bacterium]
MPSLTLQTPTDYLLARDICSYGYFLLAPNYWDTRSRTLWRVLMLSGGPVLVHIDQPGAKAGAVLRVMLSRSLGRGERGETTHQLTRMLRLDEARDSIREFHRLDKRFARSGRGRLLRSPTLFEDVIKTVTSCNVTWPNTVNMNRRLCDVVGAAVTIEDVRRAMKPARALRGHAAGTDPVTLLPLKAFPTAAQLAAERPARLRELCRVGYRDARIVELARLFSTAPSRGGVDQAALEDPATPDDHVHNTLIELPGVGPYAAANIMQLLGRYTRLPLDTESVRHGRSVLGMKGTSAAIMKRMARHYKPFGAHAFRSYWFELWDFYERKHGKAWTWERDTTGRMFTAALLNK